MPKIRITDRALRGLRPEPGAERTDYADETLDGFGVRVTAAGRRTFFVRFRAAGRRPRRTIGQYPDVSLADARQAAKRQLLAAASYVGSATRVAELVELYMALHSRPNKRTWREDARVFGKDLLPQWGHRRVSDISVTHAATIVDTVALRGGIIGNRTRSKLIGLWNFAIARGIVEVNPFRRTMRPAVERRRNRYLSSSEIVAVWGAWDADRVAVTPDVFRMLLLTGQRTSEITRMRWDEIDNGVIRLSSERTKNGRPHRVPLVGRAAGIVQRQRFGASGPYVFPSPAGTGKPIRDLWHSTRRYSRASGVSGWSPHVLRHTVKTHLGKLGVAPHVRDVLQNHARPGEGARYDHYSYEAEVRGALEQWDDHLSSLLVGGRQRRLAE